MYVLLLLENINYMTLGFRDIKEASKEDMSNTTIILQAVNH